MQSRPAKRKRNNINKSSKNIIKNYETVKTSDTYVKRRVVHGKTPKFGHTLAFTDQNAALKKFSDQNAIPKTFDETNPRINRQSIFVKLGSHKNANIKFLYEFCAAVQKCNFAEKSAHNTSYMRCSIKELLELNSGGKFRELFRISYNGEHPEKMLCLVRDDTFCVAMNKLCHNKSVYFARINNEMQKYTVTKLHQRQYDSGGVDMAAAPLYKQQHTLIFPPSRRKTKREGLKIPQHWKQAYDRDEMNTFNLFNKIVSRRSIVGPGENPSAASLDSQISENFSHDSQHKMAVTPTELLNNSASEVDDSDTSKNDSAFKTFHSGLHEDDSRLATNGSMLHSSYSSLKYNDLILNINSLGLTNNDILQKTDYSSQIRDNSVLMDKPTPISKYSEKKLTFSKTTSKVGHSNKKEDATSGCNYLKSNVRKTVFSSAKPANRTKRSLNLRRLRSLNRLRRSEKPLLGVLVIVPSEVGPLKDKKYIIFYK